MLLIYRYLIDILFPIDPMTFLKEQKHNLSLFFHNEYSIDSYKRELKQKYNISLNEEYVNPIN